MGCPVALDTARYYARQARAEHAYEAALERAREDGCPECDAALADEPNERGWLACASQNVTEGGPCDGGVDLERLIDDLAQDAADAAAEARCRDYDDD